MTVVSLYGFRINWTVRTRCLEAHRGCQSSPPYALAPCPTPSPSCHNPSCSMPTRVHLPGSVLSNRAHPMPPSCVLAALDTVTSLQWLNNMRQGFCTLVLFIQRIFHFLVSFLFLLHACMYSHQVYNTNGGLAPKIGLLFL